MKRLTENLIKEVFANLYLSPSTYLNTLKSRRRIDDTEFAELLTKCILEELKKHQTYYNINILVSNLIDLHKNAKSASKNKISSYLKLAYQDLLVELKYCANHSKDIKQIEIITVAIGKLEQHVLSKDGKLTTDKDKLEFIWYVINEKKDLEFFNIINKNSNALINVLDENLHSLFYLLSEKYIESYDEYYLSAIAAVLENSNFIINVSEVNSIKAQITLKKLSKEADLESLQKLEGLIKHYIKPNKITNSIDSVSTQSPIVEIKEEFMENEIKRRVDYKNLKTYTFSQTRISDMAISIEQADENIILYCHIIDLASYIDIGSLADEHAKHRTKVIASFFPLFDRSFINNIVLFKKNSNALALTVKVTIDKDLKILQVEPSESVITVNTAFTYSSLINALRRKENDLVAITDIVTRLKHDRAAEDNKESLIATINTEFSILVNRAIAKYMSERDKPFIYQNISSDFPEEREADYEAIKKITRYLWDSKASLSIDKWYSQVPNERVVYSRTFKENIKHGVPYGLVTEPQKNYIALENMRLLKIFALGSDPELSEIGWNQRIAEDASIATALSSKDFKNDEQIKKILINYR